MSNIKFEVDSSTLTDQSKVYTVVLVDRDNDRQPIFEAPSQRSAYLTADALSDVLQAFMFSGSDYDTVRLASRIAEACQPLKD